MQGWRTRRNFIGPVTRATKSSVMRRTRSSMTVFLLSSRYLGTWGGRRLPRPTAFHLHHEGPAQKGPGQDDCCQDCDVRKGRRQNYCTDHICCNQELQTKRQRSTQ